MCIRDRDTIVSGSRDGSAIVYTLRAGQYIRSLLQPSGHGVELVALSGSGQVLLYSPTDHSLHSFTINHRHAQPPLAMVCTEERLSALTFNASGKLVLTAGEQGCVVLRQPHDLSLVHRLVVGSGASPSPLRSLALTPDEQFVLAGTHKGTLLIWGLATKVIARNILETLDRTLGLAF